jgi:hypothetical protein
VKIARGAACLLIVLATTACEATHFAGAGHSLTVPELKYRLIDQVGGPLYCGPPVVREPTPAEAAQEVAALKASDPQTYAAIVRHLQDNYQGPNYIDRAQLAFDDRTILQQADRLDHLPLAAQGQAYTFDYVASRSTPEHVNGRIDSKGEITLRRHDPVSFPGPGGCPICLAAQDWIATPAGRIPVTELHAGMTVWSLDGQGRRVAVAVLRVAHTPAPLGHRVVRLRLEDGRQVEVSPGHPTIDGRTVGTLRAGDRFDGSLVASADLVAYAGDTWDLLPAGATHAYWADGILLGSTLAG